MLFLGCVTSALKPPAVPCDMMEAEEEEVVEVESESESELHTPHTLAHAHTHECVVDLI